MKCEDESQVRTHLESLMWMQEQLKGMAARLIATDLMMVILGFLPKLYCSLINAITMSAGHSKVDLEPDEVESLLDEFKCLGSSREGWEERQKIS